MPILVIYDSIGFFQTKGALIRGGALNWQYGKCNKMYHIQKGYLEVYLDSYDIGFVIIFSLIFKIRRRRLARLGGGGSRSQGGTPDSNTSGSSLGGATGGSDGSSVDPPTPTSSRTTTQHTSSDAPSSQHQPGMNLFVLKYFSLPHIPQDCYLFTLLGPKVCIKGRRSTHVIILSCKISWMNKFSKLPKNLLDSDFNFDLVPTVRMEMGTMECLLPRFEHLLSVSGAECL